MTLAPFEAKRSEAAIRDDFSFHNRVGKRETNWSFGIESLVLNELYLSVTRMKSNTVMHDQELGRLRTFYERQLHSGPMVGSCYATTFLFALEILADAILGGCLITCTIVFYAPESGAHTSERAMKIRS